MSAKIIAQCRFDGLPPDLVIYVQYPPEADSKQRALVVQQQLEELAVQGKISGIEKIQSFTLFPVCTRQS